MFQFTIRKLALFLFALVLSISGFFMGEPIEPVFALGTNYYIDSINGDDSNSGISASVAWKTIDKLNSVSFAAGDNLNFARESVWSGTILTIQSSGTPTNPITLKSYGSGKLPLLKNPGGLHVLEIKGDYIVVDGLSFSDTTTFEIFGRDQYLGSGAILIGVGSDYVAVKNSDFTRVGVGVKSYGLYTTITHNNFHDLVIAYRDTDESYGAICISINNSNAEISYNLFTNCRSIDSPYGADGGAIEIEGWWFQEKSNINIHHNFSSGSQGFLEVTETISSNVTIINNISDDYQQFVAWDTTTTPSNFQVYHNTVIRTHSENATALFTVYYYSDEGPAPSDSWLTFRNNIFYTPAANVLSGSYSYKYHNYPHDHNLYYGGSNSNPVGYPLGEGEIIADPQFVNFSARDLHLKATSRAINTGVNLDIRSDYSDKDRPVGSLPDIGAYEYQGSINVGVIELIIVLAIVVGLFGVSKLGRIARRIKAGICNFRKGTEYFLKFFGE